MGQLLSSSPGREGPTKRSFCVADVSPTLDLGVFPSGGFVISESCVGGEASSPSSPLHQQSTDVN